MLLVNLDVMHDFNRQLFHCIDNLMCGIIFLIAPSCGLGKQAKSVLNLFNLHLKHKKGDICLHFILCLT